MALLVYGWLCTTTVQTVGLVGEVAIGWALPSPPVVLTELSPPAVTAAPPWGPFTALQTRPTERLDLGGVSLPLAINAYTGGLADWPARAARWLVSPGGVTPRGLAAGQLIHLALGALLLTLAHRFLRFHGTPAAADAVALLLATDWAFVFYRKVLGGTEILLQAAGLLVLWALWSRRWKGGVHGTVAIAAGVGLGLCAKATFVATLAAFGVTALLMRWDRDGKRPPAAVHIGLLIGLPLLGLAPGLLAALHHAPFLDAAGPDTVLSHDTIALQLARFSAASPAREGWVNLACFLGNPLAWFGPALGAPPESPLSPLRLLGATVTLLGSGLEWRARTASPSAALLRFLSIAVPLQVGLLFLANHDLHHLAQATPPLALWIALAADRVAGSLAPPRSVARQALVLLFLTPHLLAGVWTLRRTDAVIATLPTSTFTEAGQVELVEMLRAAHVDQLVTSDYEIYGMIEARAPEIATTHTWAAERDPAAVLRLAQGGWYLSLRPTAPLVYNWHPNAGTVAKVAAEAGVRATPVAHLDDTRGTWAALYRIE